MKNTFFSRFLGFTLAFYAGSVVAIFILTIVKTAVFFQHGFWTWLLDWMKYDVFPVALAELFRSPIMGLLFAVLGARWLAQSSVIKFGIACGVFSYTVAYFFTVLNSMGGGLANVVEDLNLTEYFLLGLPVALILLSRLVTARDFRPAV